MVMSSTGSGVIGVSSSIHRCGVTAGMTPSVAPAASSWDNRLARYAARPFRSPADAYPVAFEIDAWFITSRSGWRASSCAAASSR